MQDNRVVASHMGSAGLGAAGELGLQPRARQGRARRSRSLGRDGGTGSGSEDMNTKSIYFIAYGIFPGTAVAILKASTGQLGNIMGLSHSFGVTAKRSAEMLEMLRLHLRPTRIPATGANRKARTTQAVTLAEM